MALKHDLIAKVKQGTHTAGEIVDGGFYLSDLKCLNCHKPMSDVVCERGARVLDEVRQTPCSHCGVKGHYVVLDKNARPQS